MYNVRQAAADDTIVVGDKVEYISQSYGKDGFAQGSVVRMDAGGADVEINGQSGVQEWVPIEELAKIDEFDTQPGLATEQALEIERGVNEVPETPASPAMKNEQPIEPRPSNLVPQFASENPTEAVVDAKKMVIEAMSFSDLNGQLRACCLLGMAQDKMWKSAAQQVKKKLEKEMKERVKALTKWGTVKPSQAAVLDVIEKVLMEAGITAYPNLVRAIFANPFAEMTGYQTRGNGPDTGGNTMSEPR